jgi:serine/threonine-protein kinase
MQHLQGETLASRLYRGPLPVDLALQYGVEIARALDAAHRADVVHRDLKPANVMISKSGVKLLDFGLARVGGGDRLAEAGAGVATVSAVSALTGDGTLMGTLPYMAPEQLEGRAADERTDIFALGVVLFEMTTGKRPFDGANQASLVTSIMSAEPPAMSASRAGVPPSFDRVVKKCLAKDPDARWQDAGDLAAELQWVGEQAETAAAPAVKRRSGTAAWVIGLLLAAGAAAAATWLLKPDAPAAALGSAHLTIDLPPGAVFDNFQRPVLALSPDGRLLIYGARLNGKFYLLRRAIDRLNAEVLTENEVDPFPQPFFSPDGQWVGFQDEGALKKIAVGGSAPITITKVNTLTGGSWGDDDHILFAGATRAPVLRVPASGGEPREVTTLDSARGESGHRFPEILPGGTVVIFTAGPPQDGPWHEADIVDQSLETGERHTLIPGAAQARYVAPGYLVYARAGTLYAVAFDATTLRVTGAPVTVVEGVREDPATGAAQFVVSRSGTLAYISGGLESSEVVLVDRQGRATPVMPYERRYFNNPRFSPDGGHLSVTVGGGNDAAFVHDLEHGGLSRVTADANHLGAIWTPDGERVTTSKSVTRELVSTAVDRRAAEVVLYRDPGAQPQPLSWSRDGLILAFTVRGDIWTLTLPDRRAEPLVDSRFAETAPAISPDGRWLAYLSNESGVQEVYVQEFRKGGQRWPVSSAGGSEPVWARDSERLYFREGSKLLAVGARPPFAGAVELFDAPWALLSGDRPEYDVSPDGERFVMIRPPDRSAARIHVILNWVDELQRRIPR